MHTAHHSAQKSHKLIKLNLAYISLVLCQKMITRLVYLKSVKDKKDKKVPILQGFLNFFGIAECCYIYKNFAGGCYTFLEKCCYVFFKVAKNFETLIATLKKILCSNIFEKFAPQFFHKCCYNYFCRQQNFKCRTVPACRQV